MEQTTFYPARVENYNLYNGVLIYNAELYIGDLCYGVEGVAQLIFRVEEPFVKDKGKELSLKIYHMKQCDQDLPLRIYATFCEVSYLRDTQYLEYIKLHESVSCLVEGDGWYEWNLTQLIPPQSTNGYYVIYLFAEKDELGYKAFAKEQECWPITLNYEDMVKDPSLYQCYQNLMCVGAMVCSEWVTCGQYLNYTYFVKNNTTQPIEVSVMISPNKESQILSSAVYIVKPGEIQAIETFQFSFYVRVQVKCIKKELDGYVEIWFQARKN
ncbi:MAG: DUF6385 domain-containing protein [Cellulosilyticaceae bacterium]